MLKHEFTVPANVEETWAAFNDIEQTATAGASGLQYDAASNQYTYVWKTEKAWAGRCRQLEAGPVPAADSD